MIDKLTNGLGIQKWYENTVSKDLKLQTSSLHIFTDIDTSVHEIVYNDTDITLIRINKYHAEDMGKVGWIGSGLAVWLGERPSAITSGALVYFYNKAYTDNDEQHLFKLLILEGESEIDYDKW